MPYTGPEPARRPLSSDDITDGIVSTADLADSAVTAAKIANNAVTAAKVSADVAQLGKNLIQNGAMTVAQRGTQTGLGGSTAYGALDRWNIYSISSPQGRVTVSQDTSVVPSGFGYSMKIDCTTAEAAVAAGEYIGVSQRVEAQNLQHLLYGAAGAKTLALSFWYRSPKTGTHCVSIYQSAGGRSYVREFTVSSADTFEFFTVTFPGDAAGTINNDNGIGLSVNFPLVAGTTYQDAADAWAAGEGYATSNQQNLLDNTANNIYIAGVQLEVGSVATDFEHEDYGTTLQKCYRYFQAIYISTIGNAGEASSSTSAYTANIPYLSYNWRVTPTASIRTNPNMIYRSYLSGFISSTTSSNAGNGAYPSAAGFYVGCSGTLSGLTDGMPGFLYASSTMLIDFTAEL